MEVKLGDTVRLKSGGPIMTVCNVMSEGEIACRWFPTREEEPKIATFSAVELKRVALND